MKLKEINYDSSSETITIKDERNYESIVKLYNDQGKSVLVELMREIPEGVSIQFAEMSLVIDNLETNNVLGFYAAGNSLLDIAEQILSWRYDYNKNSKQLHGTIVLDDGTELERNGYDGPDKWIRREKSLVRPSVDKQK